MDHDLPSNARETISETALEREVTCRRPADLDARKPKREAPPDSRERAPIDVQIRGAIYRLSPLDLATLHDIGRFRTVATADLNETRKTGSKDSGRDAVNALAMQGLVLIKTVRGIAKRAPLPVAVLTRRGLEVLSEFTDGREQTFYKGFVKAREVPHDAAIYRMFQAEQGRIESAGGRVRRIVLDYELKRWIYAPLARARSKSPALSPEEYARLQQAVATRHGLKVIDGKIPLPDLRVEYDNAQGERTHVDLELATHHYHGGAMATKAQAGFHFYAADGSASRLTKVLEERDITVAILSL